VGFLDALKLSRLRDGLAKTRDSILGKVQTILTSRTTLTDGVFDEIEESLLAADVGVKITTQLVERARSRVRVERIYNPSTLHMILREEIKNLLSNGQQINNEAYEIRANARPHVIMIVGVNGVGKTTTIGKLAFNYRNSGRNVLIAASDTFRAAANEQLEIWAERAGVEIIRAGAGAQQADPAAVAFDALKAAMARKVDVMIIDTAGRLHTRVNLMEELKKIKRVLQKLMPDAPHEVLLVLDASIGQNSIQQAKQFGDAVGVTGLVLTKLDGTAKGGVVLAVSSELSIPVKYIGVGERIDDLQPFDRAAFVDALFGN
jgi:fused signal recognition particle receptor